MGDDPSLRRGPGGAFVGGHCGVVGLGVSAIAGAPGNPHDC